MVNKPLIRPYFWGGFVGGDRLTSHDSRNRVHNKEVPGFHIDRVIINWGSLPGRWDVPGVGSGWING